MRTLETPFDCHLFPELGTIANEIELMAGVVGHDASRPWPQLKRKGWGSFLIPCDCAWVVRLLVKPR
jgi:hypothetical protein